MKKVGVALSGGGSRGISHLGILKAFDEAGIPISMVTGTSAGAIAGLFYCSGYTPDQIMDIIRDTKLIKYVRPALNFSGLLKTNPVMQIFKNYIKNDDFSSLKTPLVVAATNIRLGKNTFFHDGPLIRSVLASCAVPVIFEPVEIEGERYIDGGVLNNLPVAPLVGHCDLVVGINCNVISDDYRQKNMRSLIERSLLMAINVNTYAKRDMCDVFLEPEAIGPYSGFDFSKSEEIFNIGYEYGTKKAVEILALLQ